jgi:hypothetical protein
VDTRSSYPRTEIERAWSWLLTSSSAKYKNAYSFTSTWPCIFILWCLIKHGNNFTLSFHKETLQQQAWKRFQYFYQNYQLKFCFFVNTYFLYENMTNFEAWVMIIQNKTHFRQVSNQEQLNIHCQAMSFLYK